MFFFWVDLQHCIFIWYIYIYYHIIYWYLFYFHWSSWIVFGILQIYTDMFSGEFSVDLEWLLSLSHLEYLWGTTTNELSKWSYLKMCLKHVRLGTLFSLWGLGTWAFELHLALLHPAIYVCDRKVRRERRRSSCWTTSTTRCERVQCVQTSILRPTTDCANPVGQFICLEVIASDLKTFHWKCWHFFGSKKQEHGTSKEGWGSWLVDTRCLTGPGERQLIFSMNNAHHVYLLIQISYNCDCCQHEWFKLTMKHRWAHWNKSSTIRSIAGWTFCYLRGRTFFFWIPFGSQRSEKTPHSAQIDTEKLDVFFFAEAIWRNCKISTQQKLPTKSIKKLSRLNRLDPPLLFHLVWRLLSVRSYHCSFWGWFLTWTTTEIHILQV